MSGDTINSTGAGVPDFLAGQGVPLDALAVALLEQSDDCVKVIGADGCLAYMNANGRCIMQIDDFGTIAGKPWASLWPAESTGKVSTAIDEGLNGRSSRFEGFCPTAKGEPRYWEVTVSPVIWGDGPPKYLVSTSRDISSQRQRELGLVTVSQEIAHRLRNAYTVCGGLATLAAGGDPALRGFSQSLTAQFSRLADAQSVLLRSGDAGASLNDLLVAVTGHLGVSRISLIDIPDLRLREQATRAVALIVGELCTNSLKHGALRDGRQVSVTASTEVDQLRIAWDEALPPDQVTATRPKDGSGVPLMTQMAEVFGGSFAAEFLPGRLQARLELPLSS